MKIKLLTVLQHTVITDIYGKYPELSLQNKGYDYIDKSALSEDAKKQLNTIETILNDCISGFRSFSNFRTTKSGEIELRFQYNYNQDTNDVPFTGVGYVLLEELLNGFKPEAGATA